MLCSACHRQLEPARARCRSCGTATDGRGEALDLVLPGGERVALDGPLRLGRGADNDIQLQDPAVSRHHARLLPSGSGAGFVIEDLGSSYGTLVGGRPVTGPTSLGDGAVVSVGDLDLRIQLHTDAQEAGRTICIPAGASVVIPSVGASRAARVTDAAGERPRLRSGYQMKRLAASEGEYRFVLKDMRSNSFMKLREPEAELLELMDGRHSLADLVRSAEARCGGAGAGRMARLVADLADHGLLAGVDGREAGAPAGGMLARAFTPRSLELRGADELVNGLYERGGWILFTRGARMAIAAIAAAGVAAFTALIAGRYGTPFVVANRVGIGALVFLLGRFLIVSLHELAHGLALSSIGRRTTRAGFKRVLVFPYVFLDTSDSWFETRRRRIAVSLAGPVSDLTVGGVFAVACLAAPAGHARDVLFQLAFAGYVGALFNLNPLLDRDGYHVLVDVLRQPALRQRSRQALSDALSLRSSYTRERRVLVLYGAASLAWSALMVGFAVLVSMRYYHTLAKLAPLALVWTVLALFYLIMLLPLAVQLIRPLLARRGAASPERALADA